MDGAGGGGPVRGVPADAYPADPGGAAIKKMMLYR